MQHDDLFVVFSDDWGVHPSSSQHIFREIASTRKVLWVNTVGMRAPRFTWIDIVKVYQKMSRMLFGSHSSTAKNSPGNIYVIQPFMLPYYNNILVKLLNRYSVSRLINKYINEMGVTSSIVVVTAPNAHEYVSFCTASKVVYYCVDDFSEWPGLNKDELMRMELETARKSDVIVVTSDALYQRFLSERKPIYYLDHGVDLKLFLKKDISEHKKLAETQKPRVGYYGLFDERSDFDLLISIAQRFKDVSFIITGNVVADITELKKYPNIIFTGPVPYEELPEIVSGLDICILPYKVGKITDSIQPLKLKEYIATKKPVITTAIKEAIKMKEYINIAYNHQEFIELIEKVLNGEISIKNADDMLSKESWSEKARKFIEYCK